MIRARSLAFSLSLDGRGAEHLPRKVPACTSVPNSTQSVCVLSPALRGIVAALTCCSRRAAGLPHPCARPKGPSADRRRQSGVPGLWHPPVEGRGWFRGCQTLLGSVSSFIPRLQRSPIVA
eukprot:5359071-Alexandrium_andersonii.AAC.1